MACSRLARRTQKKDRDSTCCALNIRERPKVKRKREEDRRQGTRIVAELYFSPCSVESQRSDVKKKKKKTGSRYGILGKTRRAMLEGFVR